MNMSIEKPMRYSVLVKCLSKALNDKTRISGESRALEKLKPTLGDQTIIAIIEELQLMYGVILVGSLSYAYLEFDCAGHGTSRLSRRGQIILKHPTGRRHTEGARNFECVQLAFQTRNFLPASPAGASISFDLCGEIIRKNIGKGAVARPRGDYHTPRENGCPALDCPDNDK